MPAGTCCSSPYQCISGTCALPKSPVTGSDKLPPPATGGPVAGTDKLPPPATGGPVAGTGKLPPPAAPACKSYGRNNFQVR